MSRPFLAGLAGLSLLAAAPAAPADPPELTRPLGLGTPGPVRQLFLDPVLSDARAVGSASLALRLESANSWSVPTVLARDGRLATVQLDVEADALVAAVRIPWTAFLRGGGWRERVATTVGWRLTAFWGGFEDGGIEGWHHLIGSYNFLRNRYPRDHISLRLAEGSHTAFDLRSGRIAPGDLVLGTQALLAAGGASRVEGAAPDAAGWGVAARLDLKAPTGSLASAGGSGGADAALSVIGSAELASWLVAHGMVFGSVVSPLSSAVALQPRRWHAGVELSLVATAWGWALALEDRYLSPLLEGGWSSVDGGDNDLYISGASAALFRAHNQISVGLRRGPLTVTFSEDFTPGSNPRAKYKWFYDSNAPDVVLAVTFQTPL